MADIDDELRQLRSEAGTEGILTRLKRMTPDDRRDMNAVARATYVQRIADEIDPEHLITDEDERIRLARYEIAHRMLRARREKRSKERAERVAA